uniref:Ly6/PLAUR domain-containing protein 6 n=1 Tax=Castor canadensis TaxID=51338 RepID=A0A8C0W937_CASCN
MEPGPALAWLLLLSLLADCLKAAQPQDFTVKDISYLHPSTTPYPGGFKCFTCEKAADNYECNRWAPDIYCPQGKFSLSFSARCMALCFSQGIRNWESMENTIKRQMLVCTSCCEGNICNLPLPRNETDATFHSDVIMYCFSVVVSPRPHQSQSVPNMGPKFCTTTFVFTVKKRVLCLLKYEGLN